MKPEYKNLIKDLLFEQDQVDIVVLKIKQIKDETDEVYTAALGVYLMNFYNGVENIMKRCAKVYYKKMAPSADWHKDLLRQSCGQNHSGQLSLFNRKISDSLYDYLTFRHFFIHGYGFKLSRAKMSSLVENIDVLWREIKEQIAEFISKI